MTKAMVRETGRTGVMRAVTDLLTAERLLWFRMNAGDRIVESKGKRYRIRGHAKGTADLLFFIGTRPVWCECKRPGEQTTHEQELFRIDVVQRGHTYILVEDAAELQAWLKDQKKAV